MFFVFGPAGQMFRGSAEQLGQIGPVRRTRRVQALRTHGSIVQPPDAVPPQASAPAPSAPAAPTQHQDALAAYMHTAQGPQPPRQPLTQVQDVMSAHPVHVAPEMMVNLAWQRLAEQQVGQAPVLNARGQVVGLLLRADMAPLDLLPEPGAVQQAIALARRPVQDVMVSPVPTVAPYALLRRVAQVLLDTDLPGLPVTDAAGQLQGFVSRSDILRAVAGHPPLDLWSGEPPAAGF